MRIPCWLPIRFEGRPRYNRWWWHNMNATFDWVFRLNYGEWPAYSKRCGDEQKGKP